MSVSSPETLRGLKSLEPIGKSAAAQIVDLLAGSPELDFVAVEQIVAGLGRQADTVAGYPRLRPSDWGRVTSALEKSLETNRELFILGDETSARRFDSIIESCIRSGLKIYPRELFRARRLQAETRILLNDFEGAREAIAPYIDSPYALEGGLGDLVGLFNIDCRLRALTQNPDEVARAATAYALMLMNSRPDAAHMILMGFSPLLGLSPFIGLGAPPLQVSVWRRWLHLACGRGLRARAGTGWLALPLQFVRAAVWAAAADICLLAIYFVEQRGLFARAGAKRSEVLVTRAMGGIGDFILMSPGFRALSKMRGRAVRLAIPRKFFAVFENNPHVELLDIDSLPIQADRIHEWRNFTVCPAGAYESRTRPHVKKSRIELFARAIRVRPADLDRSGWNVEVFLSAEQRDFADNFLRANGFGERPLVGVQPYSRDSYKDHPGMAQFVEVLARDYDVVVFHHTQAGLPAGPGIASTAGLALSQSLALAARLNAMVSGDSAFLHAAAAFQVPVFALFGPTDGALFTYRQKSAAVFQNRSAFPCSPCWRNEDIPCTVTGRVGASPCVASLDFEPIRLALVETLARNAREPAAALPVARTQNGLPLAAGQPMR